MNRSLWIPARAVIAVLLGVPAVSGLDVGLGKAVAKRGSALFEKAKNAAAANTAGSTLATAAITLSLAASRASGVAPLAVFFDAAGTTDASVTSRPFHDLEYRWDFGDPAGSPVSGITWANGARPGVNSRNAATGPVAAHVFETSGTYTVAMTVFDGTSTVLGSVQITVQDPDAVYAGAKTVCIANVTAAAGSGGCPAGAATPAGTAAFDTALTACIGTMKRCLFKRGDTFTSNATGSISAAGPVTVAAYGAGALPVINSTNIGGVLTLANAAVNDLRIIDLDIVGSGAADTGACVVVGAVVTNVAMLRVTCQDIGKGFIIQSGSSINGSVLQDNHIYNIYAASGGVGIFGWAINSAYLGNYVGPFGAAAEHNVRLQPGQRVAISNNTITTPGTSGKAVLTVRALEHTPDAIDPTVYSAPDTQYVYISDNRLIAGNSSVQSFQIGPASNTQNNWIYDVIAERNWIEFGPVTQQGQHGEATRVTSRNNICNASGGAASGRYCFSNNHTNTAGVPTPDGNTFYNNTCYDNGAAGGSYCITLGYTGGTVAITNTTVENNLGYAPSSTAPKLLYAPSAGVAGTTGASGTLGNSSDAQVKGTNPNFLNGSGLFNAPLDFKLPSSGSYGIGGGIAVPVLSDFFLTIEPSPRDMGAVAH